MQSQNRKARTTIGGGPFAFKLRLGKKTAFLLRTLTSACLGMLDT